MKLNSDFSNAHIGQEVYCLLNGKGFISSSTNNSVYPISVQFDSGAIRVYTTNGFRIGKHVNPSLFTHPIVLKHAQDVFPRKIIVLNANGPEKTTAYGYFEEGIIALNEDGGIEVYTSWDEIFPEKQKLEKQIAELQKKLAELS
jgi:hypothetical protein